MRLFEQGDRISKTLGWKLHTWKTMVQGFLSYKCFDFVFRVTVILLHWYFSHRRKIYTWYMCVSLFSNGSQLESTMSLASLNAWHHVLKWEALLSPIQSAPISKDLQFSFRLVFFFFLFFFSWAVRLHISHLLLELHMSWNDISSDNNKIG